MMEVAEQAVYLVVGLLLVVDAFLVLGAVAWDLADLRDGVLDAATLALDGLLLVFILVELVGAVRATIRERQLLADHSLIRRGIIASIKEIVVVALKAGSLKGDAHEEALMEFVEPWASSCCCWPSPATWCDARNGDFVRGMSDDDDRSAWCLPMPSPRSTRRPPASCCGRG